MLGSQVRVTTRMFERSERDDADQWLPDFRRRTAGATDAGASRGKGSASPVMGREFQSR